MKRWGTIRIWFSEEDQEYVAVCEDYPALSWLAKTQRAAFDGLCELIRAMDNEDDDEEPENAGE